ncbi:MAG: hypothetical protein E6G50_14750 [Actinobacteria bacterium]|nr:MAG: hypothetical protein E6G50_14750 [Actinomycetota bacterium]
MSMTTHYVNQDLAKHRYATLLREADSHRLAKGDQVRESRGRRSLPRQLTWLFRVRRPALAS